MSARIANAHFAMPHVYFTSHLRRFFPTLEEGPLEGASVAELIRNLDARHPGIASYLTDERGALRTHVHVFVRDELIRDRQQLSDVVGESDRVHILQALSGG